LGASTVRAAADNGARVVVIVKPVGGGEHTPVYYGECDGKENWSSFHKTYTKNHDTYCKDGKLYVEYEQWYKSNSKDTCYKKVKKQVGECGTGNGNGVTGSNGFDASTIEAITRAYHYGIATLRQKQREINLPADLLNILIDALVEGASESLRGILLFNVEVYEPSDLPTWDFNVSVQGSLKKSEIELTPTLGVESDVKSISASLSGMKEDFLFKGSFFYSGLTNTDDSIGDTESYGLLLQPGYRLFNVKDNGFNLSVHPFIELYQNDHSELGSQGRYVLGMNVTSLLITPVGGLGLGYTFSHDRNMDGDTEITGEEYINLNTLSAKYLLPLTKSLLFSAQLSYMWVMDMPDEIEDDSSLDLSLAIRYKGWDNWTVGLEYEKSIDGLEIEGVNISLDYYW